MITVPFIYFSLLLIYQLRKSNWRIDIASFILAIYAFSAFFSILIDVFDLRSIDTANYKISATATFAYCGLLTMCIWPFMIYSNIKINAIEPIRYSRLLKFLGIVFFVYFLINFVLSFENVVNVATSDDMIQIRKQHYADQENETWMSKLPLAARIPFIPLRMMSGCSWIFIFLAFYCFVIQKMPTKYFYFYFLASINGVIENINTGGRSAMIFWLIGLIACFLFYRAYMKTKQKRMVYILVLIVTVPFALYFTAMTISRFSDRYDIDGTEGSLISYMGQSFINFCYFFDTFDCPAPTLQILFPFIYKIIGYPIQGAGAVQELLSLMSGKQMGVFYTFIGQIITTTNNFIGILFCIILSVVSIIVVKKVRKRIFNVKQSYLYLLCSSVIFLGLFGHFYSYDALTFSAVVWAIIFSLFKSRKVVIMKNSN